ncbi:MAG: orotidine-5'-phosphate decarboxylase [Longimicrobiales bacterium]
MTTGDPIIIPLDFPSADRALALVEQLGERATFYKVGFELFAAAGPEVVRALRRLGKDVFLDLKCHDIPNTVSGVVSQAADLEATFITVHASGGGDMIRAAVEAADGRVGILAVTVLTSMDAAGLSDVWGRPVPTVLDEVQRLSEVALGAGATGVVCSAHEAAAVAGVTEQGHEIVTPGIRFSDGDRHDQRRVATPGEATRAGATRLVIGRPITQASDPAAAVERARREVQSALVDVR